MIEMGVEEFAEVGPGRTLTDLIKQINKDASADSYEAAEKILERDWEIEEGKRVHKVTGRTVWNDGLEWDPDAPGAFGF
jgi:hypothetical protein